MWKVSRRALGAPLGARALSVGAMRPQVAAYDLVVVGSGPSAIQCAMESAKKGKKVAVVDKRSRVGGVCVHTGTIPSKTFREAVLHLSGYRHHGFYGKSYSVKNITIDDILYRVQRVVASEVDVIKAQLKAARVDYVAGTAHFESPHEISVSAPEGEQDASGHFEDVLDKQNDKITAPARLRADKFLIACGTRPAHNPLVPVDGKVVIDSDQILSGQIHKLPRSLIVVGAGVIGIEYASMVNVLPGHSVTVVDGRPEVRRSVVVFMFAKQTIALTVVVVVVVVVCGRFCPSVTRRSSVTSCTRCAARALASS